MNKINFSIGFIFIYLAISTINIQPAESYNFKDHIKQIIEESEIDKILHAMAHHEVEIAKKIIENNKLYSYIKNEKINYRILQEAKKSFELFLADDVDIDFQDNDGWTLLHFATRLGFTPLVKILLEQKANVNVSSMEFGGTPLMLAVRINAPELVELLLEHGADINAKQTNDMTPLMIAVKQNFIKIAKYLLEKKADIAAKDNRGATALHFSKTPEIAQLLLQNGANINAQDEIGQTPLTYAVIRKNTVIVELLLKYGANVNLNDKDNDSALDYATYYSSEIHSTILKLLLDYGADINFTKIDHLSRQLFKDRQQQVFKIISDVALYPVLANICTQYIIDLPKE